MTGRISAESRTAVSQGSVVDSEVEVVVWVVEMAVGEVDSVEVGTVVVAE